MKLLALLAVLGQPTSAHLFSKAHVFEKTRGRGAGHGGKSGNPHGWTFPAAAMVHDWRHHADATADICMANVVAEKTRAAALEKKVQMLERRLKEKGDECKKLERKGKDATRAAKDATKAARDAMKAAGKAAKDATKADRDAMKYAGKDAMKAEQRRRSKLEMELSAGTLIRSKLEAELKAERAFIGKLKQERRALSDSVLRLKHELASVGARARQLEAQLEDAASAAMEPPASGPTASERIAAAALLRLVHGAALMDGMEAKALVLLALVIFLLNRRAENLEMEVQQRRSSELLAQSAAARLEEELQTELGSMITDLPSGLLGADFSWRVWDELSHEEPVRRIKIQCPGAREQDVSIDIVFNGCVVRIARPSAPGVDGQDFVKPFQFRPSDGHFEFLVGQAVLDQGYLQLEFRASDPPRRVFRFPQRRQPGAADAPGVEGPWELPSETTESHSLHSDPEEDFELLFCESAPPPEYTLPHHSEGPPVEDGASAEQRSRSSSVCS